MLGSRYFSQLMMAFAEELEQLEIAVVNLISNSIPGLAVDLLPEWERDLGLPDTCSMLAPTIEGRQAVAHAKYVSHYDGQSAAFYINYAANAGSSITIIEHYGSARSVFRVDDSRVDRTPLDGIDGARLWSLSLLYTWEVQISMLDPNKDFLHCLFSNIKPAHTNLIWTEV